MWCTDLVWWLGKEFFGSASESFIIHRVLLDHRCSHRRATGGGPGSIEPRWPATANERLELLTITPERVVPDLNIG
ncbi:hypothetical protein R1flu_015290 [Riccia fluitans]|uniref:Uncharacterized protein n=1 Tax=Riccia fluitans TaxID=41844 RepID=A0ABD1YII8_9MARC